MSAIKIEKFLGKAPKLAPELLPETVAQVCSNIKLYSGDLIPYNKSSEVFTLTKTGPIKSIYPMDDGVGGFKWLHWNVDVDVVKVPMANNSTQRLIYTGDGEPRITDYTLATSGGGTNFPIAYYTLGLPTPLTAPTASVNSFTTKTTSTRARDSGNTATIVTSTAHGLITGAYVTITGLTDTSFNLSNVAVTVLSSTSFSYFCYGPAVTSGADTGGAVNIAGLTQTRTYVYTWYTAWGEESTPSPVSSTLYLKEGQSVAISALPSSWPGTYTGTYQTSGMKLNIYRTVPSASGTYYYKVGDVSLGTTTFTDDKDVNTLTTILPSLDYDQPPATMTGVKAIHNGMLIGFYDNTVCFSEPGQYHAWPLAYRINLDVPIVGIGNFGTSIIIGTTKNPYFLQGASPTSIAKFKMDYVLPCSSKRSIVNMGYGVAFASPSGLALYSSSTGGALVTKYVHDWDTWSEAVDYNNLTGVYYNEKYYGCDGSISFVFQKDDQVGGFLVDLSQTATAFFYNETSAILYYVYNDIIYRWDDPAQPRETLDWKSKVIVAKDYRNLGAARVIADYDDVDATITAQNAAILAANNALIATKYVGGSFGEDFLGGVAVAGSSLQSQIPVNSNLTFTLYANKQQVFTTDVYSNDIFRLPTGYRTDTYEVRCTSKIRVKAIHLGETPYGLKSI